MTNSIVSATGWATPWQIWKSQPAAPQEAAGEVPDMTPDGPMLWGNKITARDRDTVREVSRNLNVQPDDLMAVMAVETGGTFNPAQRAQGNRNGAVGLIQFTGTAIQAMNRSRAAAGQPPLSKDSLAKMSFSEQLRGPVQEYLQTMLANTPRPNRGDLYSAVFAPTAIGRSDTAVLYRRGTDNYNANRSLDTNRDGRITRAELTARLALWTHEVSQFAQADTRPNAMA